MVYLFNGTSFVGRIKRSFFQATVVSIILYRCTTWTLTKRIEKILDANYKRMQRAILNKSYWQHPTKQQLYGHLPPITKTIKVRRTRHVGHCCRPLHMDEQRQEDQLEPTYSISVPIRDVDLRTCRKQFRIEKAGGRGSENSVLM